MFLPLLHSLVQVIMPLLFLESVPFSPFPIRPLLMNLASYRQTASCFLNYSLRRASFFPCILLDVISIDIDFSFYCGYLSWQVYLGKLFSFFSSPSSSSSLDPSILFCLNLISGFPFALFPYFLFYLSLVSSFFY